MRVFGATCWRRIFQDPIKQFGDTALIDAPLNLVGNYILCFAFLSFLHPRGRLFNSNVYSPGGTNRRGKTRTEAAR